MAMQAIERIKTAWKEFRTCSADDVVELIAYIGELEAEIHASGPAVAEYRQQCLDNAQEIARLCAEAEERLQNCVALAAENERLRKDAGRKPMTDEKAYALAGAVFPYSQHAKCLELIRDAEASHNIKGTP